MSEGVVCRVEFQNGEWRAHVLKEFCKPNSERICPKCGSPGTNYPVLHHKLENVLYFLHMPPNSTQEQHRTALANMCDKIIAGDL